MRETEREKSFFPSAASEWATLNGMEACFYVTDPQTDEILAISDKLKQQLKLPNRVVEGVCWKVLQSGLKRRCGACPVDRLSDVPDCTIVWEARRPATSRFYRNVSRLIEWPDGRTVHLIHVTDITETRLAEDALAQRLKQQQVMSAISQSFTQARDMQTLMFEALKTAGEFMGVDHAFLSVYNRDEGCLECLNEWYCEGSRPYIGGESKWPISPEMDIYQNLTSSGYIAVKDYSRLSDPEFQTVKDYALRAFLNIAIEVDGVFWGVIGFIINNRVHKWSQSDIHLGKLIAGIFSGAVSRSIAEELLRKAKDEALLASKSKGAFLSSMSHEIRTPLNAIIGMTHIAKSSKDPQKVAYCLDRIDIASKHLLSIINDILDLSKIEAGKLALSSGEFDLEKLLINITAVVDFKAEEKKQTVIINIGDDVPSHLIGDDLRLSQVITNLLTNSVKFTPVGGSIALNISCTDLIDGVATLLVEVIDNGIGISQEQQARLFSPFEQADLTTTRKYGGTGLGLPICKGIVSSMGGRIWIESELGKGSKFSFAVSMKVGSATRKPPSVNIVSREDIRILAVDDAPEIRDYFMHVMPTLGLSCDVADSGARALEMIAQQTDRPYNIFFVDWRMPGLDGIGLTREIKRVTSNNAVIIMISVSDWSMVEHEAAEAGVDRFISKPLFPSLLVDAMNQVLGARASAKTAQQPQHYNFSGHTLLVAEDIEINQEIMSAILSDTQATLVFAQNGAQALSLFTQDPTRYSLILMDIQMPEMDGYEATQSIRALDHAAAKTIPILAMTANVFRADIDQCLQAGMNDHVGKPIDVDELLGKLAFHLRPAPTSSAEGRV